VRERFVGHVERFRARPAKVLLREHHFFGAERFTVRLGGVLLVRAAVADVRARDDERWPFRVGLCFAEGGLDLVEVIHVVDVQHLPAVRLEALARVVGVGEIGGSVDRDVVVVVEAD
jgi:hypothetical protein